jgi:energy-coupling factor transporter ATP-binding protein EcfA2
VKAHLLYRDRDADIERPLPWNEAALVQDLSLNTLFNAMARGDPFIFDVSRKVVLQGFDNSREAILYRQDVLRDCLAHPTVVRRLYTVAVGAMEAQKKHHLGFLARSPDSVLRYSVELMETFSGMLRALRQITDTFARAFGSDGWTTFFAMLKRELSDEYLASVQRHLKQLKFRRGVLFSAALGKGAKGDRYIIRQPPERRQNWLTRLLTQQPPSFGYTLHPRDDAGARALSELRDQGISRVADAVGQSAEHMRSFFIMLRTELAFYIGCVNLHDELTRKGYPAGFPSPAPADQRRLSFRSLYDICLALSIGHPVVGNDANADGKELLIVTGANQGGKSTFLRSAGLAQLMTQCGMFVAADSFCSSVCDGIFTHYKREEDTGMKSGKLDEELGRMSDIIDHITPHPMILFNESFSATNEREGSEIARQILSALLDARSRIICVTHLYELARGLHERNMDNALFLRAERQEGGARTFRLLEGEPLRTSFGEDLYDSIFRSVHPPPADGTVAAHGPD